MKNEEKMKNKREEMYRRKEAHISLLNDRMDSIISEIDQNLTNKKDRKNLKKIKEELRDIIKISSNKIERNYLMSLSPSERIVEIRKINKG